jgi:hypothetical protein
LAFYNTSLSYSYYRDGCKQTMESKREMLKEYRKSGQREPEIEREIHVMIENTKSIFLDCARDAIQEHSQYIEDPFMLARWELRSLGFSREEVYKMLLPLKEEIRGDLSEERQIDSLNYYFEELRKGKL